MQLLVPRTQFENGTFDPASRQDPHALLVGTKNLWGKMDTLPATHGVLNASLIAATATLVQTKLVLLQRAFYAQVSQRFVRAGDAVQRAAAGAERLASCVAGLRHRRAAAAIEANEILHVAALRRRRDPRRQRRGRRRLPAGRCPGPLRVLQRSNGGSAGGQHCRRDHHPRPRSAGTAVGLLDEIVKDINSTGEPEPPELFASTLLRLRLLLPV